jgi:hypothetical protein
VVSEVDEAEDDGVVAGVGAGIMGEGGEQLVPGESERGEPG